MELQNFWPHFGREIAHRFRYAIRFPSFVLYFLFVIIGIGMSGVFITMEKELHNKQYSHEDVILSLCTYFIALIASSSVELIVSNTVQHDRAKKSMVILGLISVLIGVCLFWSASVTKTIFSYIISICGVLFAFFIWWLANAYNQSLVEIVIQPIPPVGPLPGNPSNFNV